MEEKPNLKELVKRLGSSKQTTAFSSMRVLSQLAFQSKGNEQKNLATALAAELEARNPTKEEETKPDKKGRVKKKVSGGDPIHPAKVRSQLARLLAYCGSEGQVEALKGCLTDFDVRDMARWALDCIQAGAATEALVGALPESVGPEFRIGVVNALGYKNAANVVEVLKGHLADVDPEVRAAAGDALAKHPDLSADAALSAAIKASSGHGLGRLKQRLIKARVRLAETLTKHGHKDAGAAIYKALLVEATDDAVKRAAKIGLSGHASKIAAAGN